MPILHFQNDTDHTLNLGVLFAGLPSVCHNELAPGATWSQDFATVQFSSFVARVDNSENRFRRDDAAKDVGHIASAAGQGIASIAKGAGAAIGAFPTGAAAKSGTSKSMGDAGELMKAAQEGTQTQSVRFRLCFTLGTRGGRVWEGRGGDGPPDCGLPRRLERAALHPPRGGRRSG
jgi:hypothetical protein